MSAHVSSLARRFGIVALFLAAALLGTIGGVVFSFMGDLPEISALDNYAPSETTHVLGRDGSVIAEFATERREVIKYEDIPVNLRNAILAAEDADFFTHGGFDIRRLAVTVVRDLVHFQEKGASTISQQLARNLFPETIGFSRGLITGPERKIKEALVTLQIEKRYTKEEIFTMYCNQINFGHGAYGVEAASEIYFGKSAKDLTLAEAAMIAGIIQGNVLESPYVNMPAARARRAYTLQRMADDGFITAAQAKAAANEPVVLRGQPTPVSIAPYFAEFVRQRVQEKYGAKAVYQGGLTIKTGIDPLLQNAANAALDEELRKLDKQHGYRKPRNLLAEGQSIETYKNARWSRDPVEGDIYPAVIMGAEGGVIRVHAGRWQGAIDQAGFAWTHRRAQDLARRGDLIDVRVMKMDRKALTFTASLEQTPDIQGAVVALDNHTGEILAMIGGTNFQRSQFNRATQAMRQVGSLFKPFVYAAAIDRGYTTTTMLQDVPTTYDAGPNQPPYSPRNFDGKFEGAVPLRWALEDSRNVPTIGLMAALGPANVIEYTRRFGITVPLPPYLPIAIGAGEDTLLEMTAAYTTWPNQGVRVTPLPVLEVTDRDGNVLEENRPEPHEAIRADTAYIITNLLEGVTQEGTAKHAASLDWPIGGKTGTTDDATDAWFIGFDPDITVGVWVGFDQKKSLGSAVQGAVVALPIWEDIMKPWIAKRRAELKEPPTFERPNNVIVVDTGTRPEVYIAGTEPHPNGD